MSASPRPLLIVSDLDGCLLDEASYSWEPAREALDALRARRIGVVLATSKTRAELRPIARALDLDQPAIVENGGALVIPKGHLRLVEGARLVRGYQVVAFGAPRAELVAALAAIAAETRLNVRGFSEMGVRELRRLTGLDAEAARRALEREHDEPFTLARETPAATAALTAAADRRGLRVTRGGRFLHLTGRTDKGHALQELLRLYAAEGRLFHCVALGDAANDVEMLETADRPILLPRSDGKIDAVLRRRLPDAERAPEPGPAGWRAAVLKLLAERPPARSAAPARVKPRAASEEP